MIKKFKITGLDCANCARELEEDISKIKGIDACRISFLTEKISIEADDAIFDKVLQEAIKKAKNFEDGAVIHVE